MRLRLAVRESRKACVFLLRPTAVTAANAGERATRPETAPRTQMPSTHVLASAKCADAKPETSAHATQNGATLSSLWTSTRPRLQREREREQFTSSRGTGPAVSKQAARRCSAQNYVARTAGRVAVRDPLPCRDCVAIALKIRSPDESRLQMVRYAVALVPGRVPICR
jgi:hypothetical protein